MQTMRKKTFNVWSNGRSLYKWRVFEKRFQNILYKFLVEYSFSPFFLGGCLNGFFFLNFGVLLFSFFNFILLLVYFPVRLFVCLFLWLLLPVWNFCYMLFVIFLCLFVIKCMFQVKLRQHQHFFTFLFI